MAGLNILTLGSGKTYTNMVALGISNMRTSGSTVYFTVAATGEEVSVTLPAPADGISITNVEVNASKELIITLSDNTKVNAGVIPTVKGDKGDPFKYSDFTPEQLDSLKGSDGFSPSAKIEKVGDTATITITDKDGTTTATIKDGQGGTGGSGEENKIDSISVNGVNVAIDENKNVDITVPSIDGLAKTEDIPTKVSELTNDSGYLTEHQDISGKVDKVDGKSLIADTEIERLASVDNYNDAQIKTQIQAVANGLMDSVGYSADYKTIDIIAKNGVKKSVNVAPIISHASITELSDVDTTNKATGKALVYNATTSKHEYADVSGTDEKVKMDSSTDAKYLGELLDNVTIANENGELKVKKLDGQEVTITEINYLKGLTMNVMDLVNMFSNGGVKIINTPVATYAELLTLDKSSFIEGVSYLVYVLADENHDNAKTTYLVDKDSEIPTYFGFADSQRDFTTNPIDLATEITGKLGISNMDSDAIKALFTVDDTYKTETATNNAFSTHGAKALYDELLLAIGNKANSSDLTAHKDDTDIHVSTEDRTKWDSAKTHADSAHAPSNAQANVLETVKVNNQEITPDENKAVNIDLSDYAKKTDIPTTLPADGGNADTVNNHTVETNVPADAVFTDTIYDDTEVKGSIAELSSNLDTLEYSEIAGGKNLLKWNTNKTITYNGVTFDATKNGKLKLSGTSSTPLLVTGFMECTFTLPQGTYTISSSAGGNTFNLYAIDGSTELLKTLNGTFTLSKETEIYLGKWTASGTDMNYDIDLQIEEGSTATPYEPHIPSVKMLADKVNAQQSIEAMDLKMLGWNVPSEFPIQNEVSGNQFIQKVGRVDLGELAWSYTTNPNRFLYYLANIKSCDVMSIANVIVTDKLSVTTFDDVYSHASDNILGVSGRNVGVYASSYTDVESFKNAMKGVYLYYELATPITKTIDGNEAVEELSSNLSQLEFGEVAGGKNLQNVNSIVVKKAEVYITDYLLPIGTYTISFVSNTSGGIDFYSKELSDGIIGGVACQLKENQRVSKTFTVNSPTRLCSYSNITATLTEIQIEKGSSATPYEPYFPSNKMLAVENERQNTEAMDTKMLGWNVPSECPVQNTFSGNTFTQRVGRIDLGSLEWIYDAGKNNVYGFAASIPNAVLVENTDTQIRCFANGLNEVSASNIITLTSQNLVGLIRNNKVYVTSSYTSEQLANFIASMQDKYLYYELATPITMTIDENEVTERINKSLSVIGKCKNLLKPTLQTTTQNGVTCTNNGDGTYTLNGTASSDVVLALESYKSYTGKEKFRLVGCPNGGGKDKYYLAFRPNNSEENRKDIGSGVTFNDLSTSNKYAVAIIVLNGTTVTNLTFKPMLVNLDEHTELSNITYDDFVPYTGDGKTLTHDVAELKNDLSTKIYELAGSELYLCVSGKSCVLTLNGYNLTGSTNFSKLAEYPPYLVARNVVSKEDGVCIFSVDPDGNIGASDLQVASSVTGKMFGEVSWVANI